MIVTPAHVLRGYTWGVIKANTGIREINGIVPIIPVQDEPLVTNSGKTYMIYGYVEDPNTALREIGGGLFVLRILSDSISELNDAVAVLIKAYEMEDDSAANINAYSSTIPAYSGIRFTRTFVQYADNGVPTDEEGGKTEAVLNIRFEYISHKTIKTFTGFTMSEDGTISGGTWA